LEDNNLSKLVHAMSAGLHCRQRERVTHPVMASRQTSTGQQKSEQAGQVISAGSWTKHQRERGTKAGMASRETVIGSQPSLQQPPKRAASLTPLLRIDELVKFQSILHENKPSG
jgi:hypothetical protein